MSTIKNENYNKLVEFIKIHQEDFYRLAYSHVHNRDLALDIVQDSIYKGLTSTHKIKDISKIKSWMFTIVVNTAISYIRKNKRLIITNDLPEIIGTETIEIADRVALYQAIEQLDLKYRTIIILRYFEDMKIEEVAQTTGVNINTVKSRIYIGLEKLKAILNK